MTPAELIDQLASPERWVRQQAKELLYRLPTEAVVAAADARLAELLAGQRCRARPMRRREILRHAGRRAKRKPSISCTS